ncbi:MAG: hypothetical protein QXR69_03255, partial [Conexivisphaerales archaeon]
GKITIKDVHTHILRRRSLRSNKNFFTGWTGTILIDMSKFSEEARWLFSCASIIGMGPDSAFGSGFVEIFPSNTKTEITHHVL